MQARQLAALGALCLAAACAEAVRPPAPVRDLNIVVPSLSGIGTAKSSIGLLASVGEPDICYDETHNEIPCPPPPEDPPPPPPAGGGDENPPPPDADVPPEFTFTRFYDATTSLSQSSGEMLATGLASFRANEGTGRTTMQLRKETSTAPGLPAETNFSTFLPLDGSMLTMARMGITTTCGGVFEASSTWAIWFQWTIPVPGGPTYKWQHKTKTVQATPVAQSACSDPNAPTSSPNGEAGGGAGPDEEFQTCYWLVTWNIYTGEIESAIFMGCSPQ